MTERPVIAPSLTCTDIDKTYEFFTSVLGFGGYGKWGDENGTVMHASVVLPTENGIANVMMGPKDMVVAEDSQSPGRFAENVRNSPDTLGNGVALWFYVPDVDAFHEFVKKNGATIVEEPTDQFWGDRTMGVEAPDGYLLMFATPIEGFEAPEGMGEADGVDAVQATAPGATQIDLPSS